MSHLVQTMAYAGEVPWHGLGAQVEKGSSIETWIDASGLTWTVETADVAVRTGPLNGGGLPSWQPANGHKAIYRSDNGKLFHIATERYKPVQPQQVLEFFRDLADSHGMEVETCGALKDGAIVWALATNGNEIKVAGTDRVKPYLLLSTAMDGTQATRACYTAVRVVCNNTMRLSMGQDKESAVHVRHSTTFDADDVKGRLGLLTDEMQAFSDNAETLATRHVARSEVDALLLDWFGQAKDKDKPVEPGNLTTQSSNVIADVERSIVTSPGADYDSTRGTAWGVLQGVTHYVDHAARARSTDNRLTSAWFGKGSALKSQAFADLLAMPRSDAVQASGAFSSLLQQDRPQA